MIITIIIFALIFRDLLKDSLSEYLTIICLGAIFWIIMVPILLYLKWKWKEG